MTSSGDVWAPGVLRTEEVDGVPTFSVDTGQTPAAVLTFRAGLADETLSTHGWLHLIEHMALHGRDTPTLHTNGSVGLWSTDFQVSGDLEDVVRFLHDVCAWLVTPDLARLEHERKVLTAEGAKRQTGDVGAHLDYRYGARGVGLPGYAELGLRTATEDRLRSTLATFFTHGNATLATNFAVPAGLRLPLVDGHRVPLPDANPVPLVIPSHVRTFSGDLALSGLVTDSPSSPHVMSLVARRLTDKLRHELGASYATQGTVERVDAERLLLCLWSDVLDDHVRGSVEVVRRVLDDLATTGPTEEELAGSVVGARRALADDPTGGWQAFNSAVSVLRGDEVVTVERVRAHLDALTPETVHRELHALRDSALYSSPAGEESTTLLPFESGTRESRPQGTSRTFKGKAIGDPSRLHLSEVTMSVTGGDTDRCRALADVTALLRFPDGARTLAFVDGFSFTVDPRHWRNGDTACALLDSSVPASLHVPMDERSAEQLGKPRSVDARALRPLARLANSKPVFWAAAALGALILVVGLLQIAGVVDGPGVVPVAVGIGWLWSMFAERHKGP